MKKRKVVWSSKEQKWIPVEAALSKRCLKCGGRLVLEGEYLKCENGCGKVSVQEEEVLEGREWIVKALMGKIVYVASAGEDGSVFKLAARVPTSVWAKIKEYFWYASCDEDVEGLTDFDVYASVRGWVTANENEVSRILREEAEKQASEIEREEVQILMKREEEEKKRKEEERKKRAEEKKREEQENWNKHLKFVKKVKEISSDWVDVSWKHHEIAQKINPSHKGFKTIAYDPETREELWQSEQDSSIYCICGEVIDMIYHKMPKSLVEEAEKNERA